MNGFIPKSECSCGCHRGKNYDHELGSNFCPCHNPTPKSELGDWAREFDNIDFSEFSNEKDMMKFVMMSSEKVKSFISDLLSQKDKVLDKWQEDKKYDIKDALSRQKEEWIKTADQKIIDLMREFANTPLDKRGNGWDWLKRAKDTLIKQLEQ